MYEKGSTERTRLEETLKKLRSQLPLQSELFINGTSRSTVKSAKEPLPAEHATIFTNYSLVSKEQVAKAIELALQAKKG